MYKFAQCMDGSVIALCAQYLCTVGQSSVGHVRLATKNSTQHAMRLIVQVFTAAVLNGEVINALHGMACFTPSVGAAYDLFFLIMLIHLAPCRDRALGAVPAQGCS